MESNCYLDKSVYGNSIDIDPQGDESEIKADIVVSEYRSVRLWGRVINCYGAPVANALIKLVRVRFSGDCGYIYEGIAHTVSDCQGFYQFDLCTDDCDVKYKILVNKSTVGTERVIVPNGGNCNLCAETRYNPCGEYRHKVCEPYKIECCGNKNEKGPHGCGCPKCRESRF